MLHIFGLPLSLKESGGMDFQWKISLTFFLFEMFPIKDKTNDESV